MSDSGEFQEIGSNYGGKCSRVPSQPSFQVFDQSKAATDACRLIHGICLNHREMFFSNPRPMFDSSQTPYEGILHSTTRRATGKVPVQVSTKRHVARGEERIGSKTTMPMSERRQSKMNSFASGNTTEFYG